MKIRLRIYLALILLLESPAFADLYQYTDERGAVYVTNDSASIPEKQRRHVKVVPELAGIPAQSEPTDAPLNNNQRRKAQSKSRSDDSVASNTQAADLKKESSSETPAQLSNSDHKIITVHTGTNMPVSEESNWVMNMLNRMLEHKFKDVKDPSQVPAFNTDASIDCTQYKKILDDDVTKMDTFMKEAEEKKKSGNFGMLAKTTSAIEGLMSIVNFIYDIAFTPKHCSDEFQRENKDRLDGN